MANDLAEIVGAAAAGADPITALIGLGKDLIDKFIPDPAAKAVAATRVLELQTQLQQAQIDQQNKIIAATSANLQSDHYMGKARATFCYTIIALIAWNYAICRFFHQGPLDIPATIFGMFTVIMLGFVGIPAGVEMVKQVMAMPGNSQVSVLGVKVGNNNT
jgi:Holin of 3TMs, for gene-transfer release